MPRRNEKTTGKSIIIIGAGIAGLSAGCYGQMNGFSTRIFEMHNMPGGVCTTWARKGYKIDGCLHWLTGSGSGTAFYPIWEELGVVRELAFVDHDEYARIVGTDEDVLIVHSDVDRLEQHMKELAPEDAEVIKEFTDGIRTSVRFPIPWEKAAELWGPADGLGMGLKMLPLLGFMRKWGKTTISEFAQRFENKFLREAFPLIPNLQHPPDFPMLALLMTLAWKDQKTAGYPLGGSLELSRTIERRYLDLGGELNPNARVERILVEADPSGRGDRAIGVRLADGSEHHADVVVSASDGHNTIFGMLDGKYVDEMIQGYYDNLPLFPPLVYVGLGAARSFEGFPSVTTGVSYPLNQPIVINGRERWRMDVQMYNFDPSMAPIGKTMLRVMYGSEYEYWEDLHRDPERYEAEKQSVADQVVAALDNRFPGLADAVEMRDVATPMTWVRYTGNWRGSFEGWLVSTKSLRMRMKKTLPGLNNFYMAGQWVEPGGSVPSAAISGRNVVQILCKRNRKPFLTTIP